MMGAKPACNRLGVPLIRPTIFARHSSLLSLVSAFWRWQIWAVLLGVLPLIWVCLVLFRARPDPDSEAKASLAKLAAIRSEPVPDGRNGWPEIWFSARNVPAEQMAELFAADVAEFNRNVDAAGHLPDLSDLAAYDSRFPEHDKSSDEQLCQARQSESCLDLVRAEVDAIGGILATRAEELAAADRLARADFIRSPFKLTLEPLIAPWPGSRLAITEPAWLWVKGQRDMAEQRLCQRALGWQNLLQQNDAYIQAMLAQAHIRDAIGLLAQMRAERSPDTPLDRACQELLQSKPQTDFYQCRAAANELAYLRLVRNEGMTRSAASESWINAGASLLLDANAVDIRLAHLFDRLECQNRPRPKLWPESAALCRRDEMALDPVGCSFLSLQAKSLSQLIRIAPGHVCLTDAYRALQSPDVADHIDAVLARLHEQSCMAEWQAERSSLVVADQGWNNSAIELPIPGSRDQE